MNFLYNLEFLMDRNKINRSELAKAIGIAPSTINAWYTKDYKGITLKNLSKLASQEQAQFPPASGLFRAGRCKGI